MALVAAAPPGRRHDAPAAREVRTNALRSCSSRSSSRSSPPPCFALAAPSWAQDRQSGVQITPDVHRVLISKDVAGQRWAITRNLNDGTVTGNVYLPEGGDPTFLFCSQTSGTVESVALSCYGASRCLAAPCGGVDFGFIADVALPQSFFAPPGGAPEAPAVAAATAPVPGHDRRRRRQSGLQITPDARRILISKDLGGQRWAITRNADDDTVTGNVYQADGGDPLFVFCVQLDGAGATVALRCFGAPRCEAAPCDPAQFAPIADVELPRSFFTPPPAPAPTPPPSCGNGTIDDPAEECDGADLGDVDCETATDAVESCTGTVACRADCKLDLTGCACACAGDVDCGVPIDCDPVRRRLRARRRLRGGRCVTEPVGTRGDLRGLRPRRARRSTRRPVRRCHEARLPGGWCDAAVLASVRSHERPRDVRPERHRHAHDRLRHARRVRRRDEGRHAVARTAASTSTTSRTRSSRRTSSTAPPCCAAPARGSPRARCTSR